MKPDQSSISKAITKLENAKAEVKRLLTSVPDLQLRCDHALAMMCNALRHANGQHIDADPVTGERKEREPLTSIAGMPLNVQKSTSITEAIPSDEEVSDFKYLVLNAEEDFRVGMESKDIFEKHSHDVIRGVAMQAGMPVTIVDPERITVAFVDSIKKHMGIVADSDEQHRKAIEGAEIEKRTEGRETQLIALGFILEGEIYHNKGYNIDKSMLPIATEEEWTKVIEEVVAYLESPIAQAYTETESQTTNNANPTEPATSATEEQTKTETKPETTKAGRKKS